MFKLDHRSEALSVLTMDDGKVNAMGPDFVSGFEAAWRDATEGNRAVVIAGGARAFSAGLDLKKLVLLDASEQLGFARGFMRVFERVLEHPRPTVAFVDGPAPAGGSVLALACDFRIATQRARFGVTEVAVGIPFPPPVLELVRLKLPAHEHAHALLRGGMRVGEAAVVHGWAERLGTLDDAVALSQECAEHSPLAYARAKAQVVEPVARLFNEFDPAPWVAAMEEPETLEALGRTMEKLTRR